MYGSCIIISSARRMVEASSRRVRHEGLLVKPLRLQWGADEATAAGVAGPSASKPLGLSRESSSASELSAWSSVPVRGPCDNGTHAPEVAHPRVQLTIRSPRLSPFAHRAGSVGAGPQVRRGDHRRPR